MWNRIANIILRNRFIILAIMALLTVLLGYYALTGLKIDNKYGNMLPKDSPTQITYLNFKKMFGEDGSALIIAIQDKDLYTKEKFLLWKNLGDSILQIDGVVSVISEAKLFNLINDTTNSQFTIKPIFSDVTFKEKSIDQIKKEIRRNPIYNGLLYNDSTNVSLMMVTLDENFLVDKEKQKVVIEIENLAKSYEKEFNKVHFAGLPHMRVLIGKRVMGEMYIFVIISLLVSFGIMYFFFRSVRVTLISVVVVMITVVWALGTIGLFQYNISIIMALIPPLMIVIGIPNCIYLFNKYHFEFRLHRNKIKALAQTIRKTGTAMWLTNVTTAIGFMTFLFTNSTKFFEFGVISSLNIMLCYVVSLCLIPIFASFSKQPKTRHLKHLDRKAAVKFLEKLVDLTANRRKLIYTITIILTIGTGIGIFFMKVTGNITGDLPARDPILKDIQFMEANFGGAVPFEVLIDYKERGRLFGKNTMQNVEQVQDMLNKDTLFAKSLSIVDFVKVVNMAYYNNNPNQYKIFATKDKLRLNSYIKNLSASTNNTTFSIKELVDTTNHILRVRTSMKDLGSYEVEDEVHLIRERIDSIMNPDKPLLEKYYASFKKGKTAYIDSIFDLSNGVYNNVTFLLSNGDDKKQYAFDSDPELVRSYITKPGFKKTLRKAINNEYYDVSLTGTSVVASEGTKYLVNNLTQDIIVAVLSIAALMSVLFYSFRMVVVSMIPNLIPMVVTAGIMGVFGIPLKPSTLLIFSIALGITVDNTIHFLAHYRHELKLKKWDLKECVAISIRETGLSIIYTSVILFFGFIVFVFSDFGGTQALGYLSAITYFVALFTNLILLPCLLLSYERRLTTKSFEEPLFEIYDEDSDINWDLLEIEGTENEDNEKQNSDSDNGQSNEKED
ncbi:MMPL family transporter [Fluviicola sp.]|jgi:predicted RND superfamily exporter protein|uniref:efflux RND transporter permease subunit n=1 Tax=Fluviicola sp. TaxID=1917219 RepID=UPI0028333661|nr:MMPL family transporter [Fluviicola sp.]MDR0803174.1 MMPL family transporter [Fluviicola sp.]